MEKKSIYFLGIGGIGMSALARLFMHQGHRVGGYDRTKTPLTERLESEGAEIHYEDSVALVAPNFLEREATVVIYTPAIPADHSEYNYFLSNGFEVVKRSQMLGHLSEGKFVMAVAGTHGKTSTSTLIAWLNHEAEQQGSAVLGGISKNFDSNLVLGSGDRLTLEADEFDRSFLRLKPNVAVITSADADHLDIYGTHEAVKEAFSQFVDLIQRGGALILKAGVELEINNSSIDIYRYSYNTPTDFYATNVRLIGGALYSYDIVTPDSIIEGCTLGIPGWVNIENSVAAVASLWCAARSEGRALDHDAIRSALKSFGGVKRRFEFYVNTHKQVYMDDYAHHPREIEAALSSVRAMLPGRRVLAVFQPHLYSRTKDLHEGFATALSAADSVILLPIYPARELPIEGVDAQMIARDVTAPCQIIEREALVEHIATIKTDVVITFGAGNIDTCCEALAAELSKKA
ncbi:MAG: UDP-N-acetylmuramate--L-alanine ligase [Rikenellaceae bacterium]